MHKSQFIGGTTGSAATCFWFRIDYLSLLQTFKFTFVREVGIAHFVPHKSFGFSRIQDILKTVDQINILRVPKLSSATGGMFDCCESMSLLVIKPAV